MIKHPVVYGESEQIIVDAYNNRPHPEKDFKYWDQDEVTPVRQQLKRHYIREQLYRCCYCNREVSSEHAGVWDAEHVVAKSTHPAFLFEPENLAISCKDCNLIKNDARVLNSEAKIHYPRRSSAFKIVHPHYDEYNEHIEVHINNLYGALTLKGEETILMCRLTRFNYKYAGWHESLADSDLTEMYAVVMEAKQGSLGQKQALTELLVIAGVTVPRGRRGDSSALRANLDGLDGVAADASQKPVEQVADIPSPNS